MMEGKAKFFIIGLIGILLLSVFANVQFYNTKQAIQKEKERLIADNAALQQRAEESQKKARDLDVRLSSINSDLDKAIRERSELQDRIDLLNKEKEELIEKIKTQKQPVIVREELRQQPVVVTDDAYWAGILKAKTDLELQLTNLRNELKSMQIKNEETLRDKDSLSLDISTLRQDREDLRRQLEYNQKIMDSIAQEVVRERNDKSQIQQSIRLIKNENLILKRQIKSLNNHKTLLEKRLGGLQEEKVAIERKYTDMETALKEKAFQLNVLKGQLESIPSKPAETTIETPAGKRESVDLPPIVVRPSLEAPVKESPVEEAISGLEGKILAINRDNNFVVIDLGADLDIKVGDTFQVYREGKSIATLETIQVRKNISACDIKQEIEPIKIGDTIR